jgi:hypothetical protein
MARSVPSLFLTGAVLYAAGTLLAVAPPADTLLVVHPPASSINETVRAKRPAVDDHSAGKTGSVAPADGTVTGALPSLPRPPLSGPDRLKRGQWVEVVGYMAVARAEPAASGYVLAGYPVGQPFRVIAQKNGFVRVQDLRSGQMGWIRETSLTPYTGYPRHATPPPILIAKAPPVTAAPEVPSALPVTLAAATPQPDRTDRVPERRGRKPFALGPAAEAEPEASSPETSPPETEKRGRFWRVAERPQGDSFPALMQRAFSGY